MRDGEPQVGPVIRFLVPLTALVVLWMLSFAAMGHLGTALAIIAFVTLIVIPNRFHRPNGPDD